MQDYESLESKGIDLWSKGQDAARWKVFRLGTSAHNVLMVNGQQQRYESKAPVVTSKPGRSVVDLSATYQGALQQARRGVRLLPDRSVVVQDEFAAGAAAHLRWAMVTRAEVHIDGAGIATLTRDGKTMGFRVVEPAGTQLKIYATDPPPAPTDAPNPGTRMLGFELEAPAGVARRIVVRLTPATAKGDQLEVQPLAKW